MSGNAHLPAAIQKAGKLGVWALACVLLAPAGALANLISDGDFEGADAIASVDFNADDPSTYDIWIDVNQWVKVEDGGNTYAGHVTDSNNTNFLFQGIDASGLNGGADLYLDFDYIFGAGGSTREVRLLGLGAGGTQSRFAPWNCTACTTLQTWDLGVASDWTPVSQTYSLAANSYEALVLGFVFSSGPTSDSQAGIRGVDNVNLRTAEVPEPGTLGLFGLGLALLGFMTRFRRS